MISSSSNGLSSKTFVTVRLPDLVSISIILLSSSTSNSSSLAVYLYDVEEGKRRKYEIVDMIEAQRQLLLKEFSRM